MEKLSVVVNTKNAERTLAQTLRSVSFADEIIVVDMKSSDDTVKIAKKYTKNVFAHPDVGYVEPARNFAISKATHDWVLIVDADEEVQPELKKTLKELLQGKADADCYYLPRKNLIFDKWIQKTGWWPDYQLRFFRKSHVEWSDEIHSFPITTGNVAELPADENNALLHHNYQSVSQFITRLNRYTDHEVPKKEANKTSASDVIEAFNDELFKRLFAEQGIDEGLHGVSLSFLQAFYQLAAQLKVWEKQGFSNQSKQQLETISSLKELQKGLGYWIADWHVQHSSGFGRLLWQVRRKLML